MNANLSASQMGELAGLIEALHEERIAPEDAARLDRWIRDDESARWVYVQYANVLAALSWDHGEGRQAGSADQDGSLASPNPVPSVPVFGLLDHASIARESFFPQSMLFSYAIAALLIGLGLLTASLVYVSQPSPIVSPSRPVRTQNPELLAADSSPIVGRITRMADCVWGAGPTNQKAEITNHQSLLRLGDRLALRSGLLEITYDTGAKVLLQGPVTYEVESPAGGYLSVGKLTARLEKKSEVRDQRSESANQKAEIGNQEFVVRTPTALVTDLGTEFGVEVDEKGRTISHVFRGSVRLEPIAVKGKRTGESRILRADESAEVAVAADDGSLSVQTILVDPTTFVRPSQLPQLADDLRLKSFRRWQAYSQDLRHDPSLLAYYDFQQRQGEPAVLPNVAANGGRSLDGVVENAAWVNGRMSGKHALRFGGQDDCVRINLPQKTNDLTLAAWINVESLENGLISALLISDGWLKNGLAAWQLPSDGCVSFSIFPTGDTRSVPVFADDRRRLWTHLAVVYDHAACIRFYVDGRVVDERAITGGIPLCMGASRIGSWEGPDHRGNRMFFGRIDEMAIFGRALSTDEISRMFEAGKPATSGRAIVHSNGK